MRPASLSTLQSSPQFIIVTFSVVISVCSGVACKAPNPYQIVFIFIAMVLTIVFMVIILKNGSFIDKTDQVMFYSTLTATAVNYLIVGIVQAAGMTGNEAIMIVLILTIVPCFFIWNKIINSVRSRQLMFLDRIMDDSAVFEEMKNPQQFVSCSLVGFQYAHPICINWSLMRLACEKWPKSMAVWSLFAKFAAIYPEENRTLELIFQQIRSNRIKGHTAKMCLEQISSVLRLRETNLAASLKKKLGRILKLVENTKHKLRRIWDLVIQGNITEMSNTIHVAHIAVQKCEMEFTHLLSQYPNNRFVVRTYARFLKEIKADQNGFSEWMDKIRLLQRNTQISTDRPHELGLDTFPALPNCVSVQNPSLTIMDSETISVESELDEEASLNLTMEQTSVIKKSIDQLVIPGIKFSKICTFLNILILLILPSIAMLVYASIFVKDISEPLDYLFSLSLMRSLAFQISVFEIRYVLEHLPYLDEKGNKVPGEYLTTMVDTEGFFPQALGGYNETREQLEFLLTKVTTAVEGLNSLRAFKKQDEDIDEARYYCFSESIAYTVYTSLNDSTSYNMSLQDIMLDFSIQVTHLLERDESDIDQSVMLTTEFLNPNNNCERVAQAATTALRTLREYFTEFNETLQKILIFIECIAIVVVAIYLIIIMSVEFSMIQSNKKEVYRCLTALPKNVVSSIVESLRVLKKDTTEGSRSTELDSELSKQEENILKVFASAGESTSVHVGGQISLIICSVFIMGMTIGSYAVLCKLYSEEGSLLVTNSPHLDFLLGSYGYMMGSFLSTYSIVVSLAGYNEVDPDPYYILKRFNERFSKFQTYYGYSRYGVNDTMPFSGFTEGVANAKKVIQCQTGNKVTTNTRRIIECIPIALDIPFIAVQLKTWLRPYEMHNKTFYDLRDEHMNLIWYLASSLLYDSFFYNMFNSISPQIRSDMNASIPNAVIIIVILIIFAFVFMAIIYSRLNKTESDLKFALELLLQCPAAVITQTHKIQATLNGDFKDHSKDSTNRDTEFFEAVVDSLPDGVICANEKFQIISTNKAFKRMLEIEEEIEQFTDLKELLNKTFVNIPNLEDKLFHSTVNENNKKQQDDNLEPTSQASGQYIGPVSGSTIHLIFTVTITSKNVVVTIRDDSQIVTHNTLIAEERAKSDRLLSSILPSSLVKRVQNGETNISFAVQSATITFIDIVEFTPWCGSNTATKVMSTLNALFKEFDALVATHITMTKIKCIGDCYMAAGGIFSDVNQPAVHAKEVVEFGLEAIEGIKKINESQSENLRIRVGINTGGPIVAGVLGVGKPTFEILGPAINMAQQMEHHGVPMQVHISILVYELIYGDSFIVKERGQIEVKNGAVTTYLVTGKKREATK
ncbi:Adenylate and Guanylate cyclase catalytic domain containing protein [Tritrichomonas foetus]|uniref:Adenylate and Guanylate cyclase catalytic domain containing protein n=1 Tax=Tritrichomonas foetus TaxID=1144522 RepID=A0A1J4JJD5_9EUKA|nr:Adenylate and Guanylate cyclase catalytic domain containing protein [Tritrichomonas foetus]|eukprot:OHS99274.1 Adenylate and Guanylate cyclase catalytic domain containing protein [Tritrichomonas foetus]